MKKLSFVLFIFLYSVALLNAQTEEPDTLALSQEELNYKLILAADSGNSESILRYLQSGANVNAKELSGISALMYAVGSRDINSVRVLVSNGADIDFNYHPSVQLPALSMAASNNDFYIAEYLLQKGANPDITGPDGQTPLMLAAGYGYWEIVTMLYYFKASLDSQDVEGNTPLMYSVYYGNYQVASYLLEKGAKPDLADNRQYTPLHVAAMNGDTSLVQLLVAYGANPEARTVYNTSVYDFAVANDHLSVLTCLKKDGELPEKNTLIRLAYRNGNNKQVKDLRKAGYKNYIWPVISHAYLGTGCVTSFDDFMFSYHGGLFDRHYGLSLELGYATRFWAKRVMVEDVDFYYQFWERRSMFFCSLDKSFLISRNGNLRNEVYVGVKGLVSYGHYRGIELKPDVAWLAAPRVGWRFGGNVMGVFMNYEYVPFNILNISNHRINLGFQFNILMKGRNFKYKNLTL